MPRWLCNTLGALLCAFVGAVAMGTVYELRSRPASIADTDQETGAVVDDAPGEDAPGFFAPGS